MTALRAAGVFLAVGLPYAGGSQLANSWFNAEGAGAMMFPSAGITLAALVLLPVRWWPAAVAGAGCAEFVVDLIHGLTLTATAGYTLANTVQPVLGATLLLLAVGERVDISRMRDLGAYLACAVIAAPAAGGAIGATTFVLAESGGSWFRFAGEWWIGDGIGMLVVGISILAAAAAWRRREGRGRATETVVLVSLAVATAGLVFWLENLLLAFAPVALLLVIGFRLGMYAVTLSGAGIAVAAAEATAGGHTFWEQLDVSPQDGLIYLQLVLAFIIVTPLLLTAALRSRDQAVRELAVTAKRAALMEVSAALSAATTEAGVVSALEQTALRPFGAKIAFLAVVDGDDIRLTGPTVGILDGLAAWEGPFGQAIAGARRVEREFEVVVQGVGLGSCAVVPLPVLAAGPRGAVGLGFRHPHRLTGGEWQRLEALAEMTAHALARARLLKLEGQARRNAEILEAHAERLAGALTINDVARATVAEVQDYGIHSVAFIRCREPGTAEVLAVAGLEHGAAGDEAIDIGTSGLTADVLRSGDAVIVQTRADYDELYPERATRRGELPSEALAVIPLQGSGGTVLGALYAGSHHRLWLTGERTAVLTGLARQAGVALERATLFDVEREERDRAERAEIRASRLYSFTDAVSKETDPERLHAVLASKFRSATGAAWAGVFRLDTEGRTLRLVHEDSSERLGSPPEVPLTATTPLAAAVRDGRLVASDECEDGSDLRAETIVRSRSLPLLSQDERLGAVHLLFEGPPPLAESEPEGQAFFEALSRQSGLALQRAGLIEEQARARGRAELTTTVLSELEALSGVERRTRRLVELLVPAVADYASVELPDERPAGALTHRDPEGEAILRELRDRRLELDP
ncbi:MAG: GAF domain-containing protein, partial [Gaiella sp.]